MQQTYDQPKIPSINLFSKQLIFAIKLLQFAKQNISWEQIILQSILYGLRIKIDYLSFIVMFAQNIWKNS